MRLIVYNKLLFFIKFYIYFNENNQVYIKLLKIIKIKNIINIKAKANIIFTKIMKVIKSFIINITVLNIFIINYNLILFINIINYYITIYIMILKISYNITFFLINDKKKILIK